MKQLLIQFSSAGDALLPAAGLDPIKSLKILLKLFYIRVLFEILLSQDLVIPMGFSMGKTEG
jgi:hypothetical protein